MVERPAWDEVDGWCPVVVDVVPLAFTVVVDAELPAVRPDRRWGVRGSRGFLSTATARRDDAAAIVNGLIGDKLDQEVSRWSTPMTIRMGDTVVARDGRALPDALGRLATVGPRVCVLVHGLMSTESIWRFPGSPSTDYGRLLEEDHGVSVLSVRYNTGRHISLNGRELALLLDHLMAAWPVRVKEINLIGHSMGGLVVRSACHYARRARPRGRRFPIGRRWTSRVRRVVLIGVPNTGAQLEALVNSASSALWSLPIPATRLVGLGLDQRSAGIKDLRFGAIVDEDWIEQDPGGRHRTFPHREPRMRRADHLVIVGTVTADPEHALARWVGDALVTSPSASGHSTDGELFRRASIRTFPGITHNSLAHHRDVYDAITDWW